MYKHFKKTIQRIYKGYNHVKNDRHKKSISHRAS